MAQAFLLISLVSISLLYAPKAVRADSCDESATKAAHPPLVIGVGQTEFLRLKGDPVVRVQSARRLQVRQGTGGIFISAKAKGQGSLTIGPKTINVVVVPPLVASLFQALQTTLKDMKGPCVYLSEEGEVRIAGEIWRFSDWEKIASTARQFPIGYVTEAIPDPDVRAAAIASWQEASLIDRGVRPQWAPLGPLEARLPASQGSLKSRLGKFLGPFGVKVEVAKSGEISEETGRFRLTLVQSSERHLRQLGLHWNTENLSAQVLPQIQNEARLGALLKALEEAGEGQVITETKVTSENGSPVKLHSGGEFPVRVRGRKGLAEVQWKKYGLSLDLVGKWELHEAVHVELETELSVIDMGQAVEGIPGVRTHRLKNRLTLGTGATFQLGQIDITHTGRDRDGWPWLSQLPFLGRLFGSESSLSESARLVLLLTAEGFGREH